MEPLKDRMDFEFETLQKELVKEIEQKVNLEIEKAEKSESKLSLENERLKFQI